MFDEPDVREAPANRSIITDLRADLKHCDDSLAYLQHLCDMLHDEGEISTGWVDARITTELHPVIEELAAAVSRVRGVER